MQPLETVTTSNDKSSLLHKSKDSTPKSKRIWTSAQCLLFALSVMVMGIIATNIDRILNLSANQPSSQETNSPKLIANTFPPQYDLIVVGAGPSGLIQANFIQENYPELSILILEKSDRVGGRSCSSVIKYGSSDTNNSITFEHGAMRFYRSNDGRTRQLLNYLNLCDKIEPFSNDILRTDTSQKKVFRVRNNYVFLEDLDKDFWLNTYNLLPNEQLLVESQPIDPPQAFYKLIVDSLVNENGEQYPPMTDKGWDEFRDEWTLNGMKLNKWSLSMLILYFNYSSEFQQLIIDSYQFDNHEPFPSVETQFFYDFKDLYSAETGSSPTRRRTTRRMQLSQYSVFTLKSGYDTVSRQLLKKITERSNPGEIKFNSAVTGIYQTLYENENVYNVITDKNDEYSASQIILALPGEPLQNLLPNVPSLYNDEDANYLIDSIMGQGEICKMNLVWNDLNIPDEILPSLIDSVDANNNLGLGSIYVWYGDNVDGEGQGSLTAIHFYNSNTNSCRSWWNLQQQTQSSGIYRKDGVTINNEDQLILLTNDVANALFNEFSQFIADKYGVSGLNEPLIGTIAPWGVLDEWGSTLHRYRVGYSSSYVRSLIDKPNQNEDIFTGISDYASRGGFVEGALNAAVDNLNRNFDIDDFLDGISECSLD